MPNISDVRKKFPQYADLSDDSLVDVVHQAYYPTMDRAKLAERLGVSSVAAAAEAPKRSMLAAINDNVIEAGNAVAGTVGSMADFVVPGNRFSRGVKDFVRMGDESQSDAVKAEKAQYAADMEQAQGLGDEISATGRYALRNPGLMLSQAAGSFAVPGVAVKGLGALATGARMGAQAASRVALGGGMLTGAAGAGGDAAGTAYDLVIQAGGTEDQAIAAARKASIAPAIVGGLGGAVGAEKLLAGGKGFAGNAVSRGLKTAGVEGLQEGFEEGLTQYSGQSAAVPYNENINPMKGVGGAAAMGAIMGGATGGVMGALTGGEQAQPIPTAGDTIRAEKVAETGPTSKAINAGVESRAVQADAIGISADQENGAMGLMEQLARNDQNSIKLSGRLDKTRSSYVPPIQPQADPMAMDAAPQEASAQFVPDAPWNDRLLTVREQLADTRVRDALRALDKEAFSDAAYYASVADNPDLPERTRDNMLNLAEAIVSRAIMPPIQSRGLMGNEVQPQQAIGMGSLTPQIGMDNSPTGRMRADGSGNVRPETRMDEINAAQAEAERRAQEPKGRRKAAPVQAPEQKPAAPAQIGMDTTPTGRMLAGQDGARPETRRDLINTKQALTEQAGQIRGKRDMGLTPDVERAQQARNNQVRQPEVIEAEPATKAIGYDTVPTGRMVAGKDGIKAETNADAINRKQQMRVQPGDILNPSGGPFKNISAARTVRNRQGEGFTVAPVEGGFVVRKETPDVGNGMAGMAGPADAAGGAGTGALLAGQEVSPVNAGTAADQVQPVVQAGERGRVGNDGALTEPEAPKETDWFAELFRQANGPDQVKEAAPAKPAPKVDHTPARAAIDEELSRATSSRDEWASKVYKSNRTQVEFRGDGPSNQASMSIGGINESRRRNAIEAIAKEISALDKFKAQMSTEEGAAQFLDKMRQDYASAEKLAADGGWGGMTDAGALFEFGLLDSLNFRGPGGKGNVTSNGLSKAVLSIVAPSKAKANREQNAPPATTGARATTEAATTGAEAPRVETPAPQRSDAAGAGGIPAAGSAEVQADGVKADAKQEDDAPFAHAGLKIRKTSVRFGEGVQQRWSVQSPENAAREANGERQLGGDALVSSRDEAVKAAQRMAYESERSKRDAAERDLAEKQQEQSKAKRSEETKGKSLSEIRAADHLAQRVRDSKTGEEMTRAEFVKRRVAAGDKPTVEMVDRIKPMSRMQSFRASNEEQRAHEKKIRDGGKIAEYWLGNTSVTKTEYDHAVSLSTPAATPTPSAERAQELPKSEPAAPQAEPTPPKLPAPVARAREASAQKLPPSQQANERTDQAAQWDAMSPEARHAVASAAGWSTAKGNVNPQGKAISRKSWADMVDSTRARLSAAMPAAEAAKAEAAPVVNEPLTTEAPAKKAKAKAQPRAGGAAKHPRTVMGSRILAIVSNAVGGLDVAWLSEFSIRHETKAKDKYGRPRIQWRNPMIPGIGKLFRPGGTQDLQLLAETLEDYGYLPPGTVEADYKEAGEAAKQIIRDALNRSEAQTQEEMEAERVAANEAERDAYYAELDGQSAEIAEAERVALLEAANIELAQMDALADDDVSYWDAVDPAIDVTDSLREWGFTEQEIEDARAQEADRAASRGDQEAGDDEAQGPGATAKARKPAPEPAAREGLTLTSESEADAQAKADREAKALKADAAQKAATQERLRKEAEQRDLKARADETAGAFELGQSAERQMSGVADMFAEPASATTPAVEPEPTPAAPQAKSEAENTDAKRDRFYKSLIGKATTVQLSSSGGRTIYKVNITAQMANAQGIQFGRWPETDSFALRPLADISGKRTDEGWALVDKREQAAEKASPAAKIQDFGEKLEGARKDYATKLSDAMSVDVAAEPLSKSWPDPDYQKLLDGGADPFAVAFIHAARDELPNKPQKGWKLKGWVAQAEMLRDFSRKVLSGEVTKERMKELLADKKFETLREHVGGRAELYELMGHEKPLKGVRLVKHHYSLYRGENNVTKWVVEQDAKATAFSNWPREIAVADTKEAALATFALKYASLDLGAKAKGQKSQFSIYSRRGKPGFIIGKKIGREHIDLKSFPDSKEARAYLTDNVAELEKALETYKSMPMERREDNQPRVGEDHRNGAPVTPEVFAETFGFRGVQFGNYVEQGRRQSDLNQAYDALMDMAAVLGIPPRSLSLGGRLGLAFGARGKGGKNAHAAHYESSKVVINLTKNSGPGSLAHEWWHALDNYFGPQGQGAYITGGASMDTVRVEMQRAFAAVKRSTLQPTLRARSQELDKRRSEPYWDTPIELSARSFETFIVEKLKDQQAANDYLANIVSKEFWDANESMRADVLGKAGAESYPYPAGDELAPVRAAFDEFFRTIETKPDEAGNVILFSQGIPGAPAPKGMDADKLRTAVQAIASQWKGGPKGGVKVVQSVKDLPAVLRHDTRASGDESGARGFYSSGDESVYLIADRLDNASQAQFVLFHEVYGHHGLRSFLGDEYATTMAHLGRVNSDLSTMASMWKSRYGEEEIAMRVKAGMTPLQAEREVFQVSVEEALADLAGTNPEISGMKFFLARLQRGLRKIGLGAVADWMEDRTSAEVWELLGRARQAVRGGTDGGAKSGAMVVTSRPDAKPATDQTKTEAFRKWFGASKVVDEKGAPLVVYHGSIVRDSERAPNMGNIEQFDRLFTTKFRSPSIDTVGSWFSTNPGKGGAQMYSGASAGSVIYPVYLSIKNPQETTFRLMLRRARLLANGNDDGRVIGEQEVQAYRKWLEDMGKDGIKIVHEAGDSSTEFRDQDAWVALNPEQIKSAIGNSGDFDPKNPSILFSRAAPESPTRRNMLIAMAASAAPGYASADTSLGKAKPISAAVLERDLPANVQKMLRGNGSGTTEMKGAQVILKAVREIAANGPQELRALAAQVASLLPESNVLLTVDDDQQVNAHGAVSLAPMVHLQLFTANGRTGLTYGTFLHETLHLAVAARYKSLSSGVMRSNDAKYKMGAPAASEAMAQFRKLWDEFEAASKENPATDPETKLAVREAMGLPDEFFVRALTDPKLQAYMAKIEYKGRSMLERFKDWVTGLFFKSGVRPSWLDAALLASSELATSMKGDRADFARLRASNELASRQNSVMFSRTNTLPALDGITRQSITNSVMDYFGSAGKKMNWWDKSVGTQYNKAQRFPAFKQVYDRIQSYFDDTSRLANQAADQAKDVIPRLEKMADLKKGGLLRHGLSQADSEAIAGPIFEGTLNDKKVYDDAELRDRFKLTPDQIGYYRQVRSAVDAVLDQTVAADVLRSLGDKATEEMRGMVLDDREGIRTNVTNALQQVVSDAQTQLAKAEEAQKEAQKAHKKIQQDAKQAEYDYNQAKRLYEGGKGKEKMLAEYQPMLDAQERVTENETKLLAAAQAVQNAQQAVTNAEDAKRQITSKYEKIETLKAEGYMPLQRFGKYSVHVVSPAGETLYFGLYESSAASNKAARELRAEFAGEARVDQGMISDEAHKLFQKVPLDSLEMFAEAIGAEESEVYQNYLKLVKNNRSALKRLIKRKGTAGFSEDVPRVLASFITSSSRLASGSLNIGQATKAAQEIKEGDIKDEAIKLIEAGTNPTETAGAIRGLLFAQFIGGSAASAIVNLTQPVTMTIPYLSQFGGVTKSTARLIDAARLLATGIRDPELRRALKLAEDEGVVSPQEIHDLRAQAMGTFGNNPVAKKLMFVWGAMFSLAEQFNRRVTFVAAYNTAKQQGIADPFAFSVKAIAETQGTYHAGNKPNWARNPVGATVLTFKQYSIHNVEWMVRMYRSGPEGKKAVLVALAILALASGAEGLPFAEDLDDLVTTLAQAFGYDFTIKSVRNDVIANQLGMGEMAADVVARGLSAIPGLPFDSSVRMSSGNLIPGTGILLRSNTDRSRDVLEFAGAAGGLAKQVLDGGEKLLQGDLMGAGKAVLPVALANAAKSLEMAMTGEYRNGSDKRVADVTTTDAMMKFIGFQPSGLARESRQISAAQRKVQLAKNVEAEIVGELARSRIEGDLEATKAAWAKLGQWNDDNPTSKIQVNSAQITRRVREMKMSRADRFMKSTPKELRPFVTTPQ